MTEIGDLNQQHSRYLMSALDDSMITVLIRAHIDMPLSLSYHEQSIHLLIVH